ncbi:MAG: ParA family protein [Sulfurimonas sp.]|jgi:chromosome partitioning protein
MIIQSGTIITVAHTKGGVGKSTLAWNLAHSFKELGKTIKIIDIDFQQTLFFINAIRGTDTFTVLQPETVEALMNELQHPTIPTDITIIDVGGFDNDVNRAAIDFSDKILIPISDSVTEVLGFRTFKDILNELELGDKEINVVLNNIHPLTKNFDIIKEAVGDKFKLLNTVVRSRKIYKTTLGNGASVFDTLNNIAKDEIRGIRDELISA